MKQTYLIGLFIFTIWALVQVYGGDSMAIPFFVLKTVVWSSIFTAYLIGGFKPW